MTVDENAIRERAEHALEPHYHSSRAVVDGRICEGCVQTNLARDVLALLREREQMEKVVVEARKLLERWSSYECDPNPLDAALSVVSAPKSSEPADSLSREALDTEAVSESVSDKSPVEATGNTKEETAGIVGDGQNMAKRQGSSHECPPRVEDIGRVWHDPARLVEQWTAAVEAALDGFKAYDSGVVDAVIAGGRELADALVAAETRLRQTEEALADIRRRAQQHYKGEGSLMDAGFVLRTASAALSSSAVSPTSAVEPTDDEGTRR